LGNRRQVWVLPACVIVICSRILQTSVCFSKQGICFEVVFVGRLTGRVEPS